MITLECNVIIDIENDIMWIIHEKGKIFWDKYAFRPLPKFIEEHAFVTFYEEIIMGGRRIFYPKNIKLTNIEKTFVNIR